MSWEELASVASGEPFGAVSSNGPGVEKFTEAPYNSR